MAVLTYRSTGLQAEASIKTEVYSILVAMTLLSILAVVFRLWARCRCTGFYGWDDWLVIVALLLCFVRMGLSITMLEAGLGWQTNILNEIQSFTFITKTLFWDEGLYLLVLGVIKISILIMYYRVFPLRGFKIATWVVGGAVVTWTVGFGILWGLQCRPLVHFWQPSVPGTCMSIRTIVIVNTIPRMVLDVTILVMPVCQVWQLQMPRAQKTGLTCIFMLGSFVLIPAIWRLVVVMKEDAFPATQGLKSLNEWSHIEACVALISACLPTIRPLLTAFSGLSKFCWSHHGREVNDNNSGSVVSGVQQSIQRPEAVCRIVLRDQGSDRDLVAAQDGPCKGMVVMVSQIGKTEVKSEDIRRNNDDIC